MKHVITKTLTLSTPLFFLIHCAFAQVSPGDNYVKETQVQLPNVLLETSITPLPVGDKAINITYFDGLGRPLQKINWQGSPAKKDVVQPIVYDFFGREKFKYLPYVSSESNGYYKDSPVGYTGTPETYPLSAHYSFYNRANDKVVDDEKPYQESIFETSPLDVIIKQGAPGVAWQPSATNTTDNSVKFEHAFNTANEVLLFFYDPLIGLLENGGYLVYYEPNQLYATKTKDEHNNEVIEYVDKEGHTVCKKVQYGVDAGSTKLYASTYYIYDDLGNLVIVIPPEAIKAIVNK